MGMKQKQFLFFEKKNPKWQTKKTEFFNSANSQKVFSKNSWIGP
jgi:hypothetical protein